MRGDRFRSRPIASTRMPLRTSSSASRTMYSWRYAMMASISSVGRFQFSVENA